MKTNHYYCGCVTPAFAQIMRFWQKPAGSVSARSFKCKVDGTTKTLAMKGGTYNRSDMPLNPSWSEVPTNAQCQTFGELFYDVAVTLMTSWTSAGGAASPDNGMRALKEFFGYSSAVAIHYSAQTCAYSFDTFKNHVCPSLDAGCPAVSSTSYADTTATQGTLYYYWVKAIGSGGTSGFSGTDSGYVKIANDAFASAIVLSGYSGMVESSTLGATAQSGEPLHADGGNNSVWWTWTAPALGTIEISTLGSSFDTVLAVYTGTAGAAGTVEMDISLPSTWKSGFVWIVTVE